MFFKLDSTRISNFAKCDGKYGIEHIFQEDNSNDYLEIFPGIYTKQWLSNWSKTKILAQLFDIFEIEYHALQIDAIPPEE